MKIVIFSSALKYMCIRQSCIHNKKLLTINFIYTYRSVRMLGWCHTVTLFNTLSGRSRGKLTVEGQTGGQSEAHIDILPCNSFQHSARHTQIHSSSDAALISYDIRPRYTRGFLTRVSRFFGQSSLSSQFWWRRGLSRNVGFFPLRHACFPRVLSV